VAAPKKVIDWEAIERDYRAGVLSIREIAKQHAITDKAIRNKAKEREWQRDLTDKVNARVKNDLVRAEVRTLNADEKARTEREIVEGAAATVVQVVREHRKGIASGRQIVDLLMGQLVDVAGQRDEFEEMIELETAQDKTAERRAKLMKAVSIPSHASTVRDLSTAMKNLVCLERQAFNIKDESTPDATDVVAALLNQINGSSLPIVKTVEGDD
jgi:hypothetical protein